MRVTRRKPAVIEEPEPTPLETVEPAQVAVMESEPLVLPPVAEPTTAERVAEMADRHLAKLASHLEFMVEEFRNSIIGQAFPDISWEGKLLKEHKNDYSLTCVEVRDPESGMRFTITHDDTYDYDCGSTRVRRYRGQIPSHRVSRGLSSSSTSVHTSWDKDIGVRIEDQASLEKFCADWQRSVTEGTDLKKRYNS